MPRRDLCFAMGSCAWCRDAALTCIKVSDPWLRETGSTMMIAGEAAPAMREWVNAHDGRGHPGFR